MEAAEPEIEVIPDITEPRLWRKNGWIAKVVKNEEDDGWAVEMTRVGDAEPALVGPWTMGRDKKNPKPLDIHAFNTLVKTVRDVMQRHENHLYNQLHKTLSYTRADGQRIRANLDIQPDEDDPYAVLTCMIETTEELLKKDRVPPGFRLTAETVEKFLA